MFELRLEGWTLTMLVELYRGLVPVIVLGSRRRNGLTHPLLLQRLLHCRTRPSLFARL